MNVDRFYKVIVSPHISEKATTVGEKTNSYVFEVASDANKHEVKAAVEHLFSAKVKTVRIVNVIAKKKMFRGIEGAHKAWKKAYVTLQADEKLNIVNAG